jgi:hypothetical protein
LEQPRVNLLASILTLVRGAIERIGDEAARPRTLARRLDGLGWLLPLDAGAIAALPAAASELMTAVTALQDVVEVHDLASVPKAVTAIHDLVRDLGTLPRAIGQNMLDGAAAAELARDLFQSFLFDALPAAAENVLGALDVITVENAPAVVVGGTTVRVACARRVLKLEHAFALLRDPPAYLKAIYAPRGLADQAAAEAALAGPLASALLLVRMFGGLESNGARGGIDPVARRSAHVTFYVPSGETIAHTTVGIELTPAGIGSTFVPGRTGPGVGLSARGVARSEVDTDLLHVVGALSAEGKLFIDGSGVYAGPGGARAELAATFQQPDDTPLLVLGANDGPRLEIDDAGMRFAIASDDVSVGVASSLRLIVPAGGEGADALLSLFFPDGLRIEAKDLSLSWSRRAGLRFSGGTSIGLRRPVGLQLGPLTVDGLALGLDLGNTQALGLVSTADLTLAFGPVSGSVEGIGIRANLRAREGSERPTDLAFAFVPPNGIGLAIDAGPISGVGQITIRDGKYTGVLQLRVFEVRLTAFVLVDTKPPWSAGYSFVIMIAGEFPGIPLGFGFTLLGLGGLAGIHRGLDLPALQGLVKSGAASSLLFPAATDALALAPRVTTLLPPMRDHFVFAPMAKIGWGPPAAPLLEARLALVVELRTDGPSPALASISALGQCDLALPDAKNAIIEIHVAFVATLDLEKQTFLLLASLERSRIAMFHVAGDVGVKLAWGRSPTFILSVGGFHPAFPAPPDFPALARMSVSCDLSIARLAFEAYFAITPCTIQMGAAVSLDVDLAIIRIHGDASFDALFVFRPRFHFEVDVSAHVGIYINNALVAGIGVDLSVSGPGEWRVAGRVKLTLLFEINVPFELRWGEPPPDTQIARVDAVAELRKEFDAPNNWRGEPRGSVYLSFRGNDVDTVDPLDKLVFSQRLLPFEQRIERLGDAGDPKDGPIQFGIKSVSFAGKTASIDSEVWEAFNRSSFVEMSAGDRLATTAFDQMKSGFGAEWQTAPVAADAVEVTTDFLELQWDAPPVTWVTPPPPPPTPADARIAEAFSAPPLARELQYSIVDRQTLAPRDTSAPTSKAVAYDRWRNLSRSDRARFRVARIADAGV